MTERPISPITNEPFKVENYYFQILPRKLTSKKTLVKPQNSFTFTVFRSESNCGSSKEFILEKSDKLQFQLKDLVLNFVAISFNPSKSLTYALRLNEIQDDKGKEIGEYIIDGNSFIQKFTQTQNGSFLVDAKFNDQWSGDFELYVQKNIYGLQRMIREIKNPKPKKQTGNEENIQLAHQRIQEKRRQLDRIASIQITEAQTQKTQKFAKFSPKKDVKPEPQPVVLQVSNAGNRQPQKRQEPRAPQKANNTKQAEQNKTKTKKEEVSSNKQKQQQLKKKNESDANLNQKNKAPINAKGKDQDKAEKSIKTNPSELKPSNLQQSSFKPIYLLVLIVSFLILLYFITRGTSVEQQAPKLAETAKPSTKKSPKIQKPAKKAVKNKK